MCCLTTLSSEQTCLLGTCNRQCECGSAVVYCGGLRSDSKVTITATKANPFAGESLSPEGLRKQLQTSLDAMAAQHRAAMVA